MGKGGPREPEPQPSQSFWGALPASRGEAACLRTHTTPTGQRRPQRAGSGQLVPPDAGGGSLGPGGGWGPSPEVSLRGARVRCSAHGARAAPRSTGFCPKWTRPVGIRAAVCGRLTLRGGQLFWNSHVLRICPTPLRGHASRSWCSLTVPPDGGSLWGAFDASVGALQVGKSWGSSRAVTLAGEGSGQEGRG